MASTLQRLAKKSAITRYLAALHTQAAPNLASPLVHQARLADTAAFGHSSTHLSSFLDSTTKQNSTHSQFSHIFPSFPFGLCLNPILPIGSCVSEADDLGPDGSGMIWADSVKKKRKKKMNKHKYKKLRKRLRRQT